jgi:hypothetical protein
MLWQLTSMDSYGRLLAGEESDDTPPLDSLELAAGGGSPARRAGQRT